MLSARTWICSAFALIVASSPALAQSDGAWTPERAWNEALRLNPQLKAMDATADAARARIDNARSPQVPTLSLDASHRQSTANFAAQPGQVPKSFSGATSTFSPEPFAFWQAGASGRWTFADFGRTVASVNAAERSAGAALADARNLRRQVWLQLMSAYQGVLSSEAAVTAAQEAREQSAQRRELARSRVEARMRPPLDLLRAESDFASAEVAVLRAEEQVRAGRIALAVAIGLQQAVAGPLAPLSLQEPELAEARLNDPGALDIWTKTAAEHRDEIKALQERRHALQAELLAAQRAANPSLFLSGSATLAGTKLDGMAFNLGVAAGVTWPVSSAWLAQPQIAEVRARIRALEGQEQTLVLTTRAELDSARTAIAQVRKRRPALVTLRDFSAKAYEQANIRYAAGATTLTEVIDAAAGISQARLQLLQADLEESLAIARWRAAMSQLP